MLKFSSIHPLIIRSIKIISPLVILGSMFLELINIYSPGIVQENIRFGQVFLIIATIAITGHLIEGIIGAFLAKKKEQNPFKVAIYILFVGTIGLLELLEKD